MNKQNWIAITVSDQVQIISVIIALWFVWVFLFFLFFLPLASSNSTEYEFQAVISVSNLEQFQSILNTLSFPLSINATGEITSINTTTGKTSIYVASPLLANLIHSKCHIEPLCCVLLSVFTKHNCKHNWIPVHMWGELCLVI